MGNSVSLQTLEFFYSGLLGIGLGVLFDFFRVVRFYLPVKRFIISAFDVLFWVVATFSLFAFILTISDGKMRWYVLVGVFCGGFVYVSAVSEIVFRVGVEVVFVLKKALWISTRPIYIFLGWMWKKILSVGRKTFRKKKGGELHEKENEEKTTQDRSCA